MSKPNYLKYELALFYLCFAACSLGIALQQVTLGLFILLQLGLAMFYRVSLGALFGPGRRAGFAFAAVMIMCAAISTWVSPVGHEIDIHWAFISFWLIAPPLVRRINWEVLHRTILIVSAPGLLYSVYWLLQPDEIAWALKVGFASYPRAEGFVSNAITNAEILLVIACWSMARLEEKLPKKESRWIWLHLTLSALVVVFSRVRSGLVGFTVLVLLTTLFSKHYKRLSAVAWVFMAALFLAVTSVVGFNTTSIDIRLELIRNGLDIIAAFPLYGIGPDNWSAWMVDGSPLPEHPHNTIIGLAAESGLITLAFYIVYQVVLALQLHGLYRARHSPLPSWAFKTLCYVFVMYWVFGLFDYNFADTELLILHALHWGLISQLATISRHDDPTRDLTESD